MNVKMDSLVGCVCVVRVCVETIGCQLNGADAAAGGLPQLLCPGRIHAHWAQEKPACVMMGV